MNVFEYNSIEDQQLNKEFWVNIAAAVVIVGATIICPPAGLVLGGTYGALELSSAVSGEDWLTGRELGTGERWLRGALSPLDIVPGVAGLKKFSTGVRLSNQAVDMGQFAARPGFRSTLQREVVHLGDMVNTASGMTVQRVRSAGSAVRDATRVAGDKIARDLQDVGRAVDSAVTSAKNIMPTRNVVAMENVGRAHIPAENNHFFENKASQMFSRAEGVGGRGITKEISNADKAKIDNWNYRPSDELYLKYKEVFDNPKYYNQETGDINWPRNDGFDGETSKTILEEGMLIDRYGEPGGAFFSPEGIPYEQRALALHSENANYYVYKVMENFEVDSGKIAPWFGREGGGTQFLKYHENGKTYSIEELIDEGYIELVSVNKGGVK